VRVQPLRGVSRSCYSVAEKNAIMVKYSTNRLSPWQFAVNAEQSAELGSLSSRFSRVLLVMVCGADGIVALDWKVIGPEVDRGGACSSFSLQAKRRRREQFRISGLWSRELVVPDADFLDAWLS
jgi:hypothetical protein